MQKHLSESNELPFIPLQLRVTTHITKGEEIRMGIRLVKTEEWRDDKQVLDKDRIQIIKEENVEHEEGEMSEDEIDEQTIRNIEETTGRSRKRGMLMALYRVGIEARITPKEATLGILVSHVVVNHLHTVDLELNNKCRLECVYERQEM